MGVDDSTERKSGSGRGGDGASPPQRDRLVGIAEEAAELWHYPNREPFSSMPIDGHLENWAIRSKNFRRWLSGRFYDDFGTVPAREATEAALRVLEMKALRGPLYETFVGEHGGAVYSLNDMIPQWCTEKKEDVSSSACRLQRLPVIDVEVLYEPVVGAAEAAAHWKAARG